jgi:hypothetical protein
MVSPVCAGIDPLCDTLDKSMQIKHDYHYTYEICNPNQHLSPFGKNEIYCSDIYGG